MWALLLTQSHNHKYWKMEKRFPLEGVFLQLNWAHYESFRLRETISYINILLTIDEVSEHDYNCMEY